MRPLTQRDLEWFLRPITDQKIERYPLTNIGYDKEGLLIIEVAVAGFNKENIELEVKGNQLHITGTKSSETCNISYLQKHISTNNFERVIVLHEDYVNGDVFASVYNGILTITVKPKETSKRIVNIQ